MGTTGRYGKFLADVGADMIAGLPPAPPSPPPVRQDPATGRFPVPESSGSAQAALTGTMCAAVGVPATPDSVQATLNGVDADLRRRNAPVDPNLDAAMTHEARRVSGLTAAHRQVEMSSDDREGWQKACAAGNNEPSSRSRSPAAPKV